MVTSGVDKHSILIPRATLDSGCLWYGGQNVQCLAADHQYCKESWTADANVHVLYYHLHYTRSLRNCTIRKSFLYSKNLHD